MGHLMQYSMSICTLLLSECRQRHMKFHIGKFRPCPAMCFLALIRPFPMK